MPERAVQSALDPAARGAAIVHELGLLLYFVLGLVVITLAACTLYAFLASGPRSERRWWLYGGGVILPVAALAPVLFRTVLITNELTTPAVAAFQRIHVTGRQWWWEVRYEVAGQLEPAVLANEIHLPLRQPVEILLTTADVIHSLWIPALAGKVDMIPGRTTRLWVTADRPGVFRGQCAEFCGLQHARMAFIVVVEPPGKFVGWLRHQSQPAMEPATPEMAAGRRLFLGAGCADCHTIRGTPAAGEGGPDLTHVGGRRTLGAGTTDNHLGTMAAWIAGTQDMKPGAFMPAMHTAFTGAELRAASAYLTSLK